MRTRHLLLIRLLLSALLLAAAPASRLEAADLKPAKKRLRDSIAGWTMVPKVHIGTKGVFEVYADGRPTDRRQGECRTLSSSFEVRVHP